MRNGGAVAEGERRFKAFISYSRVDDRIAQWLHGRLENYKPPRGLLARTGLKRQDRWPLRPIFRDRTDLSSGGDLTVRLRDAIRASDHLIVLCSPASARSAYVNGEILNFLESHPIERILPVIASGEPDSPNPKDECFPPSLRSKGLLAADLRNVRLPNGQRIGDGREGGRFKLIAGLLGVSLDELLQRERRRERARAAVSTLLSAAFLGLAAVAGIAAYLAVQNEREAKRQTAAATASADFLVSTFEIAIPNSENPNSITARTILDRGAKRIGSEFSNQPAIKVRLLDAISRAYSHLGLNTEAERLLSDQIPTIRGTGSDGVPALLTLAFAHRQKGNFAEALRLADEAEVQLGPERNQRPDLLGYIFETRALIAYDQAKGDEALQYYGRALAQFQQSKDPTSRDVARVLNNRATALSDMGRFAEADQDLSAAGAAYQTLLGSGSLSLGQTLFARALNAYNAGRNADAASYLEQARRIFEVVLDRPNPILGDALRLKGELEIEAGAMEQAAGSLIEAVAIYGSAYGEHSIAAGVAHYDLAFLKERQGLPELALQEFNAAESNFALGGMEATHFNMGDLRIQRSRILRALDRDIEADADCAAGLKIIEGAEAAGQQSEAYIDAASACAKTAE